MRGLIAIYDADEHKRFTAYVDIAQDLPLRDALPLISRITRGRAMDEKAWLAASHSKGDRVYVSVDDHLADLSQSVREAGLVEGSWLCVSCHQDGLVNPQPLTQDSNRRQRLTHDGSATQVQLRFVSGVNAGSIYDLTSGTLAIATLLDQERNSRDATFTLEIPEGADREGGPAIRLIPSVTDPDPRGTAKRKRKAARARAKLERKDRKERRRYDKRRRKGGPNQPKDPQEYDELSSAYAYAYDSYDAYKLDASKAVAGATGAGSEYELTPEYSDELHDQEGWREGTAHSRIFVEGAEVLDPIFLPLGTKVVLPESIIEVTASSAVPIPVEDSGDGHLMYARPPKISKEIKKSKIELPTRPEKPEKAPVPFVSMLLPLAMAIGMAAILRNWIYLTFGVMSPVMMISSYLTGNRSAQRRYRNQVIKYRDTYKALKRKAYQLVREEAAIDRQEFPDPTSVLDSVSRHDSSLWNRRSTDASWLRLRVGTGDVTSSISMDDPSKLDFERTQSWVLHNHPITLSLKTQGCIGIAGLMDVVSPVSQWLVTQLAALHSTDDLKMVLLSPRRKRKDKNSDSAPSFEEALRGGLESFPLDGFRDSSYVSWDFAQWIPHFKSNENPRVLRNIGLDAEHIANHLAWLSALVNDRMEDMRHSSMKAWNGDAIVVVMENAHIIRTMPGAIRILQDGPSVGVYTICVGADERLLPEECRSVILARPAGLTIRSTGHGDLTGIMPDLVTPEWVDAVCFALAPLKDGTPDESASGIPNSSRLLDVLHLTPTAKQIEAGWASNPRSTDCVIGESVDGEFHVDIAKDGPHGLVGGTTGSGKSEFLQTLVASLAISNTPNAMNFVLVDYKGGAAFKDCVDLPHTVGMVTDLDNHLVARALISLGAELNYREHLLAQAGAKDLEDYIDLRVKKPRLPEIPRLLIVIDEFASLARELPDFVTGLVNIAQRGRSLGIHLLLATQRPGGVVSPEIRANTNLRIALRMTSSEESNDVIDAKDAALISKTTPGRAVVRLGSNTLIPFQSSRVGGRYMTPDMRKGEEDEKAMAANALIDVVTFDDIGNPPPAPLEKKENRGDVSVTDLKMLVGAITEASRDLGIPAQRQPWLPALGEQIGLDELGEPDVPDKTDMPNMQDTPDKPDARLRDGSFGPGDRVVPIPFALGDYPAEQKQKTISFDVKTQGNLFLAGTGRSGKSTALRTIVFSACTRMNASVLHVYGIDAGNGALLPLQTFANVGAVATRTETQKIERLLGKLEREYRRRADLLSQEGYSTIDEYNHDHSRSGLGREPESMDAPEAVAGSVSTASGEEAPDVIARIIIVVDSWDGLNSAFEGSSHSAFLERIKVLMREGPSVGFHFVVAGDKQLLGGQVSLLAEDKIVLRLVDNSDYGAIGMRIRDVPEHMANGRGITAAENVEVQIALIDKDATGAKEVEIIRSVGHRLAEGRDKFLPRESMPFSVEELPQKLTAASFEARLSAQGFRDQLALPFAIGGENNDIVAWNPRETPVLPIYGLTRSGKTSLLVSLTDRALSQGYQVVLASPKRKGLREFDGRDGVLKVFQQPNDLTEEALVPLTRQAGSDPKRKPVLFLFDDCHQLNQMPASSWIQNMLTADDFSGCAFVFAGDAKAFPSVFGGGWGARVGSQVRQGVLLSLGDASFGDLIDVGIPVRWAAEPRPEGRAMVHLGRVVVQAQVALPAWSGDSVG